jgi:hypothetical protein
MPTTAEINRVKLAQARARNSTTSPITQQSGIDTRVVSGNTLYRQTESGKFSKNVPEGYQVVGGVLKPIPGGATAPTGTEATPEPTTPTTSADVGGSVGTDVTESAAFTGAEKGLEDIHTLRQKDIADIVSKINENTTGQKSAFDRMFGEDSRFSTYYDIPLTTIEEQILDIEGELDSLEEDVFESTKDIGLTEGQRRRITSKERAPLTKEMDQLVRSQTRLQAGLDREIAMSTLEFNEIVRQQEQGIAALQFELEANTNLDNQTVQLITTGLQQQFQRDTQLLGEQMQIATEQRAATAADQAALDLILDNTINFLAEAGVTPTAAFQDVARVAQERAERGESLGEIKAGIMQAIGANPRVAQFLDNQFKDSFPSGGGGGGTRVGLGDTTGGLSASEAQELNLYLTSAGGAPTDGSAPDFSFLPTEQERKRAGQLWVKKQLAPATAGGEGAGEDAGEVSPDDQALFDFEDTAIADMKQMPNITGSIEFSPKVIAKRSEAQWKAQIRVHLKKQGYNRDQLKILNTVITDEAAARKTAAQAEFKRSVISD